MPPVPYDGGDAGTGFRVWRRVTSNLHAEILDIYTWSGSGWQRSTSGIADPGGIEEVRTVRVRPDRYLVLWNAVGSTYVIDLFTGARYGGTGTGDCSWTSGWSGGPIMCSEPLGDDGIVYFEDFGPSGEVGVPHTWGWGRYDFVVREDAIGQPWLESNRVPEFVPFLLGNTRYLAPGDIAYSVFWVADAQVFLADATTAGMRRIVSAPVGGPWSPVPDLFGMDDLSFVGELDELVLVSARDSATGYKLIAFGYSTGISTVLIAGAPTSPSDGIAFADGMLFTADDGTHGHELWFTAGTAASTRMIADLRRGPAGSDPHDVHAVADHAVWLANDGTGNHLFALDRLELDWRQCPIDMHWYCLTEPATWFEARRAAHRLGGELATVRSQDMQNWLWETFGQQNLWIGLEDFDRDNQFEWVSGEPLTFTAWCPGEPGTLPIGEDVVHMAFYPGFCVGGWNDQEPTDGYRGIAERSARPSAVESFGTGCENRGWRCDSLGAAVLDYDSGWPRLGGQLRLRVDLRQYPPRYSSLPAGLIAIGLDSTRWGAMRLPFDLSTLGP
ncbi:MAG: hypothetical protein IPM29_17280 [Planctomycetes bacterium]|nr:hypothetical protein [Planctomycetota bacterium]